MNNVSFFTVTHRHKKNLALIDNPIKMSKRFLTTCRTANASN